jgi:serine/threonine protein kinase
VVPGAIIARRYRLERCLGEGGMGVVFRATHVVTRKPVALKFLKRRPDEEATTVQRFLREARAACAVRHPSVVEIYDVLELDDGSPVMVMELLSGETLAKRLEREKSVSLPEVARIMVNVCSAVGCAHSRGIVHRDLKPENIFLSETPTRTMVKVLDFGIAKLTASEGDAAHTGITTGTGTILGTPYYMAPEQLFGEKDIDHKADIWALGVILYEALYGERPTQAANIGQIYKIVMTGAMTPLAVRAPHLPADVLELVSRMLSRDRAERPADLQEVLAVLAAYTNEHVPVIEPPNVPQPSASAADQASKVDSGNAPTMQAAQIPVQAIPRPPAQASLEREPRRQGLAQMPNSPSDGPPADNRPNSLIVSRRVPAHLVIKNEYYEVVVDAPRRLVQVYRSSVPFASAEAVEQACGPIQELLDAMGRSATRLFIDSRQAPSRNDPEYERWFEYHRTRMVSGLLRAAIVLRSAVGKLHAERMLRRDGNYESVRVFTDEEAAMAYLLEDGTPGLRIKRRRP